MRVPEVAISLSFDGDACGMSFTTFELVDFGDEAELPEGGGSKTQLAINSPTLWRLHSVTLVPFASSVKTDVSDRERHNADTPDPPNAGHPIMAPARDASNTRTIPSELPDTSSVPLWLNRVVVKRAGDGSTGSTRSSRSI